MNEIGLAAAMISHSFDMPSPAPRPRKSERNIVEAADRRLICETPQDVMLPRSFNRRYLRYTQILLVKVSVLG